MFSLLSINYCLLIGTVRIFGNFFDKRGKLLRFKSAVNSFVRFCSRWLVSLFSRKPPFYLEGSLPTEKDQAWVASPVQWAYRHRADGSAPGRYLACAQPPPGAGSIPTANPSQPLAPSLGLSARLWRCTPCWKNVPCFGADQNSQRRVQICCISPDFGSVALHPEQGLHTPLQSRLEIFPPSDSLRSGHKCPFERS